MADVELIKTLASSVPVAGDSVRDNGVILSKEIGSVVSRVVAKQLGASSPAASKVSRKENRRHQDGVDTAFKTSSSSKNRYYSRLLS